MWRHRVLQDEAVQFGRNYYSPHSQVLIYCLHEIDLSSVGYFTIINCVACQKIYALISNLLSK